MRNARQPESSIVCAVNNPPPLAVHEVDSRGERDHRGLLLLRKISAIEKFNGEDRRVEGGNPVRRERIDFYESDLFRSGTGALDGSTVRFYGPLETARH